MGPDFWLTICANLVLIIGAGVGLRVSMEHRITKLETHIENLLNRGRRDDDADDTARQRRRRGL